MKRNAAFIGSENWKKRDVTVTTLRSEARVKGTSGVVHTAKDGPSGISIVTYLDTPVDELLQTLAHRVRMLT